MLSFLFYVLFFVFFALLGQSFVLLVIENLGSILKCIAWLLAMWIIYVIYSLSPIIVQTIIKAIVEYATLLTLLMLMCWAMIVFLIIRPILYVKYILMGQHKGERKIVSKKKADGLFEALVKILVSFWNFILFRPFRYISQISQNISQRFSKLFAALKDQLK